MEKINLYQIINDICRVYGRKYTKIKASMALDSMLYVRVYFNNEKSEYESWKGKMIKNIMPEQSVMFKIWIKEEPSNYFITKTWEDRESEFILFHETGIYTNEYLMPDYSEAKAFYEAVRKWSGGNDILGYSKVFIPEKLLRIFLINAEKKLQDCMNEVSATMRLDTSMADYMEKAMNSAKSLQTNARMLASIQRELYQRTSIKPAGNNLIAKAG